MTPHGRLSPARLSSGYLVLTIALVVLVALVGGATWQALRAEASNRATAQRTLRDYSAVAAWKFAQHAELMLHDLGGRAMNAADPGNFPRATTPLVDPAALVSRDSALCDSLAARPAQFAFRIDLPSGAIVASGRSPDQAALAELARKVPPLVQTGGADRHRFVVPTIGGRPMRIAAMLVRGSDAARTPRAVYGLAYDSTYLAGRFAAILADRQLLPPVLVGRAPLRDRLFIAVRSPDGHVLFRSGVRQPAVISAGDTIAVEQGHLVLEAAIDPALAPALVIGGLPSSRLPALIAMLCAGLVLAGVGFVQLRRERELMRLRSRFVANVSHELRTPLAQISMFGETLMLGRARTDEEAHHFARIIHREARRLTTLVESVLRFSRSEAGATVLQAEPRGLAAELREAIEDFSPLARPTGARIHLEAEPAAAAHVDPAALRQIVLNLLENATKYGPPKQEILVSACARDDQIVVAVQDQGPGIPERDRQRVLEPFTRLERAGQPKVAGTGIGLAVVHDLVRAHGGRLWIEDAARGGTRVCFTLRAAPASATPARARETPGLSHAAVEPTLTPSRR